VPNVPCPSCGLSSYAVTPHSRKSLCPHCDAELFPAAPAPGEDDAERDAEAA
jgi:hypothetical protein